MSYSETVKTLLTLLELPEGQGWVTLKELKEKAEKLDNGNKK
jgi:hypothetical protein